MMSNFYKCLLSSRSEGNASAAQCNNLTFEVLAEWGIPLGFKAATQAILVANVIASLLLNTLLILVLLNSPSLKTPPNSHLVNICINNVLLCCSMVLGMVGINISSVGRDEAATSTSKVMTGVQVFLVYNSLIQYWGTFACIGYYRQKTIREPSLTLRTRRQIVSRSIVGNWIVSVLLSSSCSLSYTDVGMFAEMTLDPFRNDYYLGEKYVYTVQQIAVLVLILLVFLCGFLTIFSSYYNIFKTLNVTGTFAKNRVTPWQRAQSLASDVADLTVPSGRSYDPSSNTSGRPFTVSQRANDTLIVHYQKCDHTLAFEDILALENPILAANIQNQSSNKRHVQMTLSNGSTKSAQTRCPEFTDISMGADLERFQRLKNSSALRNQFLRRDRVSLSSATRNSLVMFCAYLVCSLPLIFCSCPRALSTISAPNRVIALLVCRLLFCLNAPVYPAWYLLFSKRVKKCLRRMMDALLLRMNVRT